MSADNVELVRRIYDAWAAGESAAPFIDHDVEYVNPPDAVETGTLRGRKSFARIRDVYDEVSVEPERYIDTAGDDVVVLARIHVKAPASGMETSFRHGYVWTVRNRQAVRFRWFNDPQQALHAAGVASGDDSP